MTINAQKRVTKHHRIIPSTPRGKSGNVDRFVLCRWNLVHGCMVETSNTDLAELMMEIPDFLHDHDSDKLCVIEVASWREDSRDGEMEPHDCETLYEIQHYNDPTEEDEEDDATIRARIDSLTIQLEKERWHYDGLMRGDIPAGFDVTEETKGDLTKMQRAALKKMGETSKALADEIDKL